MFMKIYTYTYSFNIIYGTIDLKQPTTQPSVSPPTSQKLKVLISYCIGKRSSINLLKLHEDLTTNGYECTLDVKDVNTGVPMSDVIPHKIAGCDAFIVIFSQKSSQSAEWCHTELAYANPYIGQKTLIVIKRQECDILSWMQFLLEDWLYLPFIKNEGYDESLKKLIRALEEVCMYIYSYMVKLVVIYCNLIF